MQEIVLLCRRCKRSLKMRYIPTGNSATPMLINVCVVCHHCKRHFYFKKFTEGLIVQNSIDGKLYVQHLKNKQMKSE